MAQDPLTLDDRIVIESRVHLFQALAEAAETEHNLMCLYLYGMFGLKRSLAEGVSAKELEAIERWRKVVLGICLEEMSHLSLVSNLFSALGGSPHFMRPNFPVSPGLYPSGLVVELAPFDMKTLDHFIYLERPVSEEIEDADTFKPAKDYERFAPHERLMPTSGDYRTVGELYEAISHGLVHLSQTLGEKELFCGNVNKQITPIDSPLRGLIAISDLKTALQAIETIISQGEGATNVADSHFERFSAIRTEYLELLKENPAFEPGRRVARNPVMRKPLEKEGRIWVDHPISARYMDLANALYSFMLRILVQVYTVEDRDRTEKHEMLQISFSLMHMMAVIGETLTLLPSSDTTPQCFAGMSFAMVRTLTPLAKENELDLILETMKRCCSMLSGLQDDIRQEPTHPVLGVCITQLGQSQKGIEKLIDVVKKLQAARAAQGAAASKGAVASVSAVGSNATVVTQENAPKSDVAVEKAEGRAIRIQFDAKRCIHSRHCVTELPEVFKANTPGEWLFPDKAEADVLAAVIRECPSGALTYESKGAFKDEQTPEVNVMRLFENGPYAFLSDLEVDGVAIGERATLCRCGMSKRKPFCDHSHADAGFIATGEPETVADQALSSRGGRLKIDRTENGPYSVKGNVEICAATGRVVLRTAATMLCRCGHSKTKPVCDGTHAVIGFKDSPLKA